VWLASCSDCFVPRTKSLVTSGQLAGRWIILADVEAKTEKFLPILGTETWP
jgi:hypothetical protein